MDSTSSPEPPRQRPETPCWSPHNRGRGDARLGTSAIASFVSATMATSGSVPSKAVAGPRRWCGERRHASGPSPCRRTLVGLHTPPTGRAAARSTSEASLLVTRNKRCRATAEWLRDGAGDGKEIFFLSPDASMMAARIESAHGFTALGSRGAVSDRPER